jgi:hypothetical protein
MPKKQTVSYYVLVHQGDRRQVTCTEATPQGFKQMKKLFKRIVEDIMMQKWTTGGVPELSKDLDIEAEFGQVYLVPESGELNSAPCIAPLQIMQWIEAANVKTMASIQGTT